MTLDDLNKLSSDAYRLESEQALTDEAITQLSKCRNGDSSLTDIVARLSTFLCSRAKEALTQVINEQKTELIRLAELRLAAQARELKIKAAQNKAIVQASIVDVSQ